MMAAIGKRRRRRTRRNRAIGDAERALRLLLAIALAALLVRGLVAMPRRVPSESMLPSLLPGDYVLVARWRYGWSHTSLPFGWPRFHGRLFAREAKRGDVVVFRHQGGGDYVKRVIGLPGDVVEMRGGRLILNGTAVPRVRDTDFVAPLAPGLRCVGPAQPPYGALPDEQGRAACRLPRYGETLPGGRRVRIIDQGETLQDDSGPFTVASNSYFVLGDNRDASADSRVSVEGGGVGMVSADDLEGPATTVLFSSDGSARWFAPWTWIAALRAGRIGAPIA